MNSEYQTPPPPPPPPPHPDPLICVKVIKQQFKAQNTTDIFIYFVFCTSLQSMVRTQFQVNTLHRF